MHPHVLPRTTYPGHVLTPSCDSRVVVQANNVAFYLDEHLSEVKELLNAETLTHSEKSRPSKVARSPLF